MKKLSLSGIEIEVHRKRVKNINMRVYPASGRVRITAPHYVKSDYLEQFALQKLPWIQKHLANYRQRPVKEKLKFVNGEKHLFQGEEFELQIQELNRKPAVEIRNNFLVMSVRPGSPESKKESILNEWYRNQLKKEIPKIIEKYEPVMGVSVNEFGVKRMKTRWGTCNIRARRIWLSLELAKKSPDCLEYVVVHEMVHLLERLHNARFHAFMDEFMPEWRAVKAKLNGRGNYKC